MRNDSRLLVCFLSILLDLGRWSQSTTSEADVQSNRPREGSQAAHVKRIGKPLAGALSLFIRLAHLIRRCIRVVSHRFFFRLRESAMRAARPSGNGLSLRLIMRDYGRFSGLLTCSWRSCRLRTAHISAHTLHWRDCVSCFYIQTPISAMSPVTAIADYLERASHGPEKPLSLMCLSNDV